MDKEVREFHLLEFKRLQQEIDQARKGCGDIMRWTLIGSAAVFTWLATQGSQTNGSAIPDFVWYLPFSGAILGWIFTGLWMLRVWQIEKYLSKLEEEFADSSLGWQRFLKKQPKLLAAVGVVFWIVLVLATYMIPDLIQTATTSSA